MNKTNNPFQLSVFLIIGIPFLALGLTGQKVFLPIGIAFFAIGMMQTVWNIKKASRKNDSDPPTTDPAEDESAEVPND